MTEKLEKQAKNRPIDDLVLVGCILTPFLLAYASIAWMYSIPKKARAKLSELKHPIPQNAKRFFESSYERQKIIQYKGEEYLIAHRVPRTLFEAQLPQRDIDTILGKIMGRGEIYVASQSTSEFDLKWFGWCMPYCDYLPLSENERKSLEQSSLI